MGDGKTQRAAETRPATELRGETRRDARGRRGTGIHRTGGVGKQSNWRPELGENMVESAKKQGRETI